PPARDLRGSVLRRRPGLRRRRDVVVRCAVEWSAALLWAVPRGRYAMTVTAHDPPLGVELRERPRDEAIPPVGDHVSEADRAPDRERLAAVARDHIDFVWRVLRRQGLSPADADDGVQRVFLVFRERGGHVA